MSAISIELPQIAHYQARELIHESDRTLVYRGYKVNNAPIHKFEMHPQNLPFLFL